MINLETFYNDHRGALYDLALKLTNNNYHNAQDLVQESLIKIHKNQNKIKDENRLLDWSYSIIRRTNTDIWRRNTKMGKTMTTDENLEELIDLTDNSSINYDIKRNDDNKNLQVLIDKLSSKHQKVLKTYYFDDLNLDQITKLLHTTKPAVKVMLNRARKKLKKMILKDKIKEKNARLYIK